MDRLVFCHSFAQVDFNFAIIRAGQGELYRPERRLAEVDEVMSCALPNNSRRFNLPLDEGIAFSYVFLRDFACAKSLRF